MCYSVCGKCKGAYEGTQLCLFSSPSYCLKINPDPRPYNGPCPECSDLELSFVLPLAVPLKYRTCKLKLV
jgi:hypothetical protein